MTNAEFNHISVDSDPQLIVDKLKEERDLYCKEYGVTPDDLWVLLPLRVHKSILHNCGRSGEGPDRITQNAIMGMHVIHDEMKRAYVIPKHKLQKGE